MYAHVCTGKKGVSRRPTNTFPPVFSRKRTW
jgi:hypothetical protein